MLSGMGDYFFHYYSNDAPADRPLQVRDSATSHTAGAPNPTVQQIGTGGGSSATPSNDPTSAANARLQGSMPPANTAPGFDPHGRPHGAVAPPYPAPVFDAAYGRPRPNGRNPQSTRSLPLNRFPGSRDPNGRTSSGPVNRDEPPAPAPALMQQEVPDRRESAPASHPKNAAATAGPVGARASYLPATSQAQSGSGSAKDNLQAAQLKAAGAILGLNGIPRLAPSQAQVTTRSAGSSSSSLPVTSQAQSTTAPARGRVYMIPPFQQPL
jgi:hypothetical protein